MCDNERALINLIRESESPEKVAEYMLNLFLDYLRIHAPSQETPSVVSRESA
jgi:hypothetical protein